MPAATDALSHAARSLSPDPSPPPLYARRWPSPHPPRPAQIDVRLATDPPHGQSGRPSAQASSPAESLVLDLFLVATVPLSDDVARRVAGAGPGAEPDLGEAPRPQAHHVLPRPHRVPKGRTDDHLCRERVCRRHGRRVGRAARRDDPPREGPPAQREHLHSLFSRRRHGPAPLFHADATGDTRDAPLVLPWVGWIAHPQHAADVVRPA
ncbi:hypothetical protein DMC30DRAFT_401898 [Rhodotorula diobovata]|uniref:Uncharacterized protein n=1 Tax=Rhodotorula diobovata TaxID=5288 RepID=A0A5C5FRS4_9BASI|nr:hypothetical protein DMC30DRAFT_401898 [Rhodotorula diobovata]